MDIEKRDDFLQALEEYGRQFEEVRGRRPVTVEELREFLLARRKNSGSRFLKSLKGFAF